MGDLDRDVNSLAVMAAGDAPDAAALVRILTESGSQPKIAALFDGDEGGARRKKALERLNIPDLKIKILTAGTTTEDHLPAAASLDVGSDGLTRGLANWSRIVGQEVGHLDDKPPLSESHESTASCWSIWRSKTSTAKAHVVRAS